jgi:hypothetical protein
MPAIEATIRYDMALAQSDPLQYVRFLHENLDFHAPRAAIGHIMGIGQGRTPRVIWCLLLTRLHGWRFLVTSPKYNNPKGQGSGAVQARAHNLFVFVATLLSWALLRLQVQSGIAWNAVWGWKNRLGDHAPLKVAFCPSASLLPDSRHIPRWVASSETFNVEMGRLLDH